MPVIETVYVNKSELTDEEVWLRAYCAAMLFNNNNAQSSAADADNALCFFRERFKE